MHVFAGIDVSNLFFLFLFMKMRLSFLFCAVQSCSFAVRMNFLCWFIYQIKGVSAKGLVLKICEFICG